MAAGVPMRVEADESVCIGSGRCAYIAESIFDQDPDTGIVILRVSSVPPEMEEEVSDAVSLCPVGAIRLVSPE